MQEGNPSVLWDLLKLEIPKSAADLIVIVCSECGNPYPILDYLKREGLREFERERALRTLEHIIVHLGVNARVEPLIRIYNNGSFSEGAREKAEAALEGALYVFKITGDKDSVGALLLHPAAPESAKLAAINLCREKGWLEPLESLKGKRGNGRRVLSEAARARKAIKSRSLLEMRDAKGERGRRMHPPSGASQRAADGAPLRGRVQRAPRKR
ncbi:hypothetical protein JW721_01700 [Candidatus Micrarchaeota archaeon]|nr:hypothetical protein [Candidatus Micrarchaeota archaeon]